VLRHCRLRCPGGSDIRVRTQQKAAECDDHHAEQQHHPRPASDGLQSGDCASVGGGQFRKFAHLRRLGVSGRTKLAARPSYLENCRTMVVGPLNQGDGKAAPHRRTSNGARSRSNSQTSAGRHRDVTSEGRFAALDNLGILTMHTITRR